MSTRARRPIAAPVIAGFATVATLATIGPVFSDQGWLLTSIIVVASIVLSGILLRALGLGQAYVSLVQLVVGLYALLVLATGPTMIAGFIPTADTIEQLVNLLSAGAHTARTEVAPISPTDGTATLLALLVTPVAALVDDFAVTGRPALTGIPLLTLFAICAAIVRHPIAMWLVAVPLIAFLLLLWIADMEAPSSKRLSAGFGGLLGTGLILVVALGVAAAATVVVRLPDGGIFAVPGSNERSPNETVARTTDLAGQLSRGEPIPLFTVTTDDPAPYYLRTLVLENWEEAGWSFSNTQDAEVDLTAIPSGPISNATATTHATIEVQQYSDIFVPTYYSPTSVGLPEARYDTDMAVVYTDEKGQVEDQTYQVTSRVPRPTETELASANFDVPGEVEKNVVVPNDVDPSVLELTEIVIGGAASPWAIAVALDAFFSDPAQGFTYSLEVPDPEGADPLASFLDKRVGFCEQYASAMASMFRIADVAARVVVGYTNGTQNEDGTYTITTDDAHAWVEAYFGDAGWVSFDPTPIGERSVPLPYVPSDQITPGTDPTPTAEAPTETQQPEPTSSAPSDAQDPQNEAANDAGNGSSISPVDILRWTVIALVALAILALPGLRRRARWQNRLAAASAGGRRGAVSAWAEIAELADALNAPAVATLSQRAQAARWTGLLGAEGADVETIGAAAERATYGADDQVPIVSAELQRARATIRRTAGAIRWLCAVTVPTWMRRLFRRVRR